VRGIIRGGGGPPFSAVVTITDPDGDDVIHPVSVASDGTFELDLSTVAPMTRPYLGCDKTGMWEAWFIMYDGAGGSEISTTTYWTVNFPRVHGIP
jgi:hypothetical protein